MIAACALPLGALLIARREEERGAELLAAAVSLREESGVGFADEDAERMHHEAVAEAKDVLGDEAFAAAWARGEAMTPEEVAAFAQGGGL
jgi:hypothetical protein